jgi:tetratricopeptide (TPR) repeat protein
MARWLATLLLSTLLVGAVQADEHEHHSHPVPEKLGKVSFPTSCDPAVQASFERGVALLHSFAYNEAEKAMRAVAAQDAHCAIAHWGIAMSLFHQIWDTPAGDALHEGAAQVRQAEAMHGGTTRERQFIEALNAYYADADNVDADVRAERYAQAMAKVAQANPKDTEAQVFYALSLIATASPSDKTHANLKKAGAILEPIYAAQPQHPGVAHYLIHAYDTPDLAPRGLTAARAYAQIAPSAPHALHMPSHIFTRLGYWDDSITSNLAARKAASDEHDVGEELHAMDYLTYAYLQRGRAADAVAMLADTRGMTLKAAQFKSGYAATAIAVRVAVERKDWDAAAKIEVLPGSAPNVAAMVYWARALGNARAAHPRPADADIAKLEESLKAVQADGKGYWPAETDALLKSAKAWQLAATGDIPGAVLGLRAAADEEDAFEKPAVSPGPAVPAREQLGELLLQSGQAAQALREFQTALTYSPRRRGALEGAIAAAEKVGDKQTASQLRAQLAP